MRLNLHGLLLALALSAAVPHAATAALPLLGASAVDSRAAARVAAEMTGGRVVDVQTGRAGGRVVYVVKVLLGDGRVKVIHVDQAAEPRDAR